MSAPRVLCTDCIWNAYHFMALIRLHPCMYGVVSVCHAHGPSSCLPLIRPMIKYSTLKQSAWVSLFHLRKLGTLAELGPTNLMGLLSSLVICWVFDWFGKQRLFLYTCGWCQHEKQLFVHTCLRLFISFLLLCQNQHVFRI